MKVVQALYDVLDIPQFTALPKAAAQGHNAAQFGDDNTTVLSWVELQVEIGSANS